MDDRRLEDLLRRWGRRETPPALLSPEREEHVRGLLDAEEDASPPRRAGPHRRRILSALATAGGLAAAVLAVFLVIERPGAPPGPQPVQAEELALVLLDGEGAPLDLARAAGGGEPPTELAMEVSLERTSRLHAWLYAPGGERRELPLAPDRPAVELEPGTTRLGPWQIGGLWGPEPGPQRIAVIVVAAAVELPRESLEARLPESFAEGAPGAREAGELARSLAGAFPCRAAARVVTFEP